MNKKGFTFVEIIIVIAIIAVLSAIAVPIYAGITAKAEESQCEYTRAIAVKQYSVYKNMGGVENPDGEHDMAVLVDAGYLIEDSKCSEGGIYTWSVEEGDVAIACSVHVDLIHLFSGSFSLGDLGSMFGDWEVSDGTVINVGNGEHRVLVAGTKGEDYKITTNASFLKDSKGGYGIYYRASGEAKTLSGYVFQFDPGLGNRFVVREVNEGRETRPIASVKIKDVMDKDFDLNELHEITIDIVGNQHNIYVDGEKVLELRDSTFTSGSVGFRTWSKSTTVFTDLDVEMH